MDIDIFQRIHVADQQADGKMLIFLKSESESESCSVVSDSLRAHGLCSQWNPLSQNTGLGSLSVLQGIFPTPGIESRSPALQVESLPPELSGKPSNVLKNHLVLGIDYVQPQVSCNYEWLFSVCWLIR